MLRFLKMFIVIVIIGIVLAVYVWNQRASIISSYLSHVMPTTTTIKDLRIAENEFIIKDLHVSNPKGSQLDTAFASEIIRIVAKPRSLLSRDLVIDEIAIDHPFVGVEFYSADGSQSNWSLILNKLNLAASEEDTGRKTYLIKKVVMTDVKLHVVNSALGTEPFDPKPLSRIEFRNVGSDKPLTLQVIIATIFRAMLQEASQRESLKAILKGIQPLPTKIDIEHIPLPLQEKKIKLLEELLPLPKAADTP